MADQTPVQFTSDTADRIIRAVRAVEQGVSIDRLASSPGGNPRSVAVTLKVTGSLSSGLYPARVQTWSAGSFSDLDATQNVWLDPAGATYSSGNTVRNCSVQGVNTDGVPVYTTGGTSGSGSGIQVTDTGVYNQTGVSILQFDSSSSVAFTLSTPVSGTTKIVISHPTLFSTIQGTVSGSFTGVNTLQFDNTSTGPAFQITSPSSGVVAISLPAASHTSPGYVDINAGHVQCLGNGAKGFSADIEMNYAPLSSAPSSTGGGILWGNAGGGNDPTGATAYAAQLGGIGTVTSFSGTNHLIGSLVLRVRDTNLSLFTSTLTSATLASSDPSGTPATFNLSGTNAAFAVNGTNGVSGTVTLAKITVGGTNGSLTFTGGIITAFTAPT